MPQAVVDPEELRQFARRLKKFNADVENGASSIANQLATLSASWRDQEQKKFTEQFDQHMTMLKRFTEMTNEHIPYLLRKAEHIERYLQG